MKEIFYGDIFRVNGKGCLFFGHGKTKAGRVAINQNSNDEISLDFAELERDGDDVYGRFNMPEIPNLPTASPSVALEVYLKCLSEEETKQLYANSPLQIIEVNLEQFTKISNFNINFIKPNSSCTSKFVSITNGSSVNRFLLVPWMDSHELKGQLIAANI